MAIAYRYKYPEASAKAKHYNTVANDLRSQRSKLSGDIRAAKARKPADFENTRLKGDYYTKYVNKKEHWITQLDQISAKFDRFLLQVDICIKNANALETMWNKRINTMEAYDDGTKNKSEPYHI